jgi:hypothetical protein
MGNLGAIYINLYQLLWKAGIKRLHDHIITVMKNSRTTIFLHP